MAGASPDAARARRPAKADAREPRAAAKAADPREPRAPAKKAGEGEHARFARLGIRNDIDLALHLPMRYVDETRVVPVVQLVPGDEMQVEGTIRRSEVVARGRRMLVVELDDDTGSVVLRFFNFYGSQLKQLAVGNRIRARGTVRGGLLGLELIHPTYRAAGEGATLPGTLTPVYPTAAGISQYAVRSAIRRALARLSWPEALPPELARGLPPLGEALALLHAPPPDVDLHALEDRSHPAWRRIVMEELLAQQVSLRRARELRDAQRAVPLPEPVLAHRLLETLPFVLTGAQQRVWAQVERDLSQQVPMHRLLQGDVGSGKTVIAALAAAQAVGSGHQVALMAPTEILAEQHYRKLSQWLPPLGVRIAWLSGSLKESEKRAARAACAAGTVELAIGTHALIEDKVEFERLGLAVVDEQHRFGVGQRLALRGKRADAGLLPHQLMMSATPIPRTLAMTYYADLDVSVIDELPPGRTPIRTKLVSDRRRDEVIERVRAAVESGRQAYWVCPLIEESEALDLQSAMDSHEELRHVLADLRVGLVHGRLPPADKAAVMDEFVAGRIDVLVATTVIEVGVDVPNASLMVIEHAERFGLAQLHQLRGRVGRGEAASVCILIYRHPLSPTARERLKIVYESSDGFEIARRDLQLRGPGEFLGARQSGVPLLRFADLERDADLVERARDAAPALLAAGLEQARVLMARWLPGRENYLEV